MTQHMTLTNTRFGFCKLHRPDADLYAIWMPRLFAATFVVVTAALFYFAWRMGAFETITVIQ